MCWLRVATATIAVVSACVVPGPASAARALACQPTIPDAFGPFGQGSPPVRSSVGTGHVLTGVVLSAIDCKPIKGARVELWQANAKGRYVRALSATVLVDRNGRFRFEGPYPASYEGRPPHIHLRVVGRAHEVLLSRYEPRGGARSGTVRLVLVPLGV